MQGYGGDAARFGPLGELRIDHVGMLLSDMKSSIRVNDATPDSLRRLAMISLGVPNADGLVAACYEGLA